MNRLFTDMIVRLLNGQQTEIEGKTAVKGRMGGRILNRREEDTEPAGRILSRLLEENGCRDRMKVG